MKLYFIFHKNLCKLNPPIESFVKMRNINIMKVLIFSLTVKKNSINISHLSNFSNFHTRVGRCVDAEKLPERWWQIRIKVITNIFNIVYKISEFNFFLKWRSEIFQFFFRCGKIVSPKIKFERFSLWSQANLKVSCKLFGIQRCSFYCDEKNFQLTMVSHVKFEISRKNKPFWKHGS